MGKCGECKACCTLFPILEISKPAGVLCSHYCDGCTIHESKPKDCADYECAYFQSKDAPESLRPDKCGVVFTKKSECIFSGILTGDEVTDAARGQIDSFIGQGYSVVLISTDRKPHVMAPDGRDPDAVYEEYKGVISGDLQH